MRQRWLSGRALLCHLAVVLAGGGCLAAFWWQLHRALDGNTLSWAYTFEWPFFAGFAVVVWWQLLHDDPQRARTGGRSATAASPEMPRWDDGGDEQVAAYNRYLEELAASGRRKSWRSS